MSLAINTSNDTSPFDSIRRTDEKGEYWLARDFMFVLGYPRWADFKDVIDKAKKSCENTGNPVTEHFSGLFLKNPESKQGRRYQDYRLSRYASYLVAMNGDPRKPEIAAAQSYFAIKTREAEVIIPAQNTAMAEMDKQIKLLELQNENLKTSLELRRLDSTMITLHGPELVLALRGKSDQIVKVETVVTEVVNPKTERCDRIVSSDQLKQIVNQNTGQSIKSMKWFVDEVKRLNRNDLLVAVTRHQTGEYVSADGLGEAIALVFSNNRQMVIGE